MTNDDALRSRLPVGCGRIRAAKPIPLAGIAAVDDSVAVDDATSGSSRRRPSRSAGSRLVQGMTTSSEPRAVARSCSARDKQ
jgi:hypothetical protein